jgi:hypothetical protein
VGLGPRELEDVGEEALGQAVPAHDALGQGHAGRGELDGAVHPHEALGRHAPHHLGDGRSRDPEAVGDPGLDDVEIVLGQLVDGLAVGGEALVLVGHAPSVRTGERLGRVPVG